MKLKMNQSGCIYENQRRLFSTEISDGILCWMDESTHRLYPNLKDAIENKFPTMKFDSIVLDESGSYTMNLSVDISIDSCKVISIAGKPFAVPFFNIDTHTLVWKSIATGDLYSSVDTIKKYNL